MTVKKILYIEDNVSNRFLMEVIFRRYPGYELALRENCQSGLDYIYNQHIDLLLLDQDLPDMTGFEVISLLKTQPAYQHIPIIMLTADNSPSTKQQALALGCDEFELKPFSIVILKNKIDALLEIP